ncbi:MAG TPA: hypothetical protein VGI56_11945 [Galbitalea sp.]|jgi:hypothetical protein
MSMTSKRLEQPDAITFCDMMGISHSVIQEAYASPGKTISLGIMRVTYNPLSATFTFKFIG